MKKLRHMLEIIRAIDQYKAAGVSIMSALFGSIDSLFQTNINSILLEAPTTIPVLQSVAWMVAIGAGLVSILNGIDKFLKSRKAKRK